MILLDTNVISEFMRPVASPAVLTWVGSQPAETLFTTTITQAEVLYGIALLPEGARRRRLSAAAEATFAEEFPDRILSFDQEAARAYADIVFRRRQAGRPIGILDAQIAAIARSRQAVLATRNVADFEGCDIALVNPWTADAG